MLRLNCTKRGCICNNELMGCSRTQKQPFNDNNHKRMTSAKMFVYEQQKNMFQVKGSTKSRAATIRLTMRLPSATQSRLTSPKGLFADLRVLFLTSSIDKTTQIIIDQYLEWMENKLLDSQTHVRHSMPDIAKPWKLRFTASSKARTYPFADRKFMFQGSSAISKGLNETHRNTNGSMVKQLHTHAGHQVQTLLVLGSKIWKPSKLMRSQQNIPRNSNPAQVKSCLGQVWINRTKTVETKTVLSYMMQGVKQYQEFEQRQGCSIVAEVSYKL